MWPVHTATDNIFSGIEDVECKPWRWYSCWWCLWQVQCSVHTVSTALWSSLLNSEITSKNKYHILAREVCSYSTIWHESHTLWGKHIMYGWFRRQGDHEVDQSWDKTICACRQWDFSSSYKIWEELVKDCAKWKSGKRLLTSFLCR